MKKTLCVITFLLSFLGLFGQDYVSAGLDAYARSDWSTAILSFRKAITVQGSSSEPWYWLIMSEISSEDFTSSLQDIDRFAITFPKDERIPDIQYQKGRVQFIVGKYEESIRSLYEFITAWPAHSMVPSAYYWIGENLYAVGRFDEAKNIFQLLIAKHPNTIKREAAFYRIAIIDQNSKQDELLKLLKMSHEESLRIIEDYQRREKTYEQAITAYQKRISDMIKDTRLGELETQLGNEKVTNSQLLDKISSLEIKNADLASALALTGAHVPESQLSETNSNPDINSSDPDKRRQAIEELQNKAESLKKMYQQIDSGGSQ
jgi:tetratricopeptide (TPR) repeat protein